MAGTVLDSSGGAVADCRVRARHSGTGIQVETRTSRAGEFALPELALGRYSVTAECAGFATSEAAEITAIVSVVSTLNIIIRPEGQAASVLVEAPAENLETKSSARNIVVGSQLVSDLPLNGRDFLRLLRLSPGIVLQGTSFYAVNGNRGRSNNFQLDGADNNDAWQNASAGNQGGVSAVPNTLVPVEAIDQFSLQSIGSSEQGRNSGANVNLAIRSGTNELHGSVFYFNRNEALAANSPVAPPGSAKRKIRNHQYGVSLGGPVVRNRTFFFATFEGQRIRIGNALLATTPSDAWLERGRAVLRAFNVAENPVSRNLLSLWPAVGRSGADVSNNFFSDQDNDYLTDNGILKLDHAITERHNLSVRYFGATGSQTAFSGSPYREYFQVATSRLHNYALALTSTLSPSTVNQFVAGVNYFKPTFNDADRSADPAALGLNTGVTEPELRGAPTINLSGFAGVGPTQPQGRVDTTWHLTDTASMLHGRHQWKLGGEVRVARLDVFNEINKRGTFTFDGSGGPWSAAGAFSQPERVLADFLAGYVSPNSGARITRGRLARELRQNSWDLFAHDSWQITPTLNINYGARYTYLGVLRDTADSLTTFLPQTGIVVLDRLYPRDWNNVAPRVGLAWQPSPQSSWTVRAGYGIYYDLFHITYFASNSPSNSGASGVNANPGGPDPVFNLTRGGFQLVPNEPVFGGVSPVPPFGAYSVSQDLRTPYVQNYHFTVQRQLGTGPALKSLMSAVPGASFR